MPINVLFAADDSKWAAYSGPLIAAMADAGLDAYLTRDLPPEVVDYIVVAPNGPLTDFTPYTRAKAVMCLWAGVEDIVHNETLTQPLTRMVDPGLSRGMVEWVTGHVLRHHLGMDKHITGQDGVWHPTTAPLAADRPVTILGMGVLGRACGAALAHLGFPVTGWNRSAGQIDGIITYNGNDGLRIALQTAQIAVLLLPLTPDTRDLIDAQRLSWLPRGAILLNPGRGPLIDDGALLAALDDGQIGHATLDVFRTEPLPADHPYWAHPQVTVTPHIASPTRPASSVPVIAENIRRSEAGQPLLHLVDRSRNY